MFWQLFLQIAGSLYYLALHVTGAGSFPPPLSSKEEEKLLEEYKNGDENAKNRLIEHNLRLVAHIVKKYYASGCEPEDLISIGTIGLIKAVNTFKGDRGIRLATYAARCIENEILMYFRNTRKTAQDVYISDPLDTDRDGNALTLIDVIADENDVSEQIDKKIKLERLGLLFDTELDEREIAVLEMRYGLRGKEQLAQREIAAKLNISRSYVSRIEKAALQKLRKRLEHG
ncbi:MAG: RNA polymerase sporulation sigma factor SigK [Clostridia bacterium]|nr:RNA polymerase sporulation sigma factor SigK [Clostridia bacterium]